MDNKQWFESWFDSPYYHILYQHRDDTEAQGFMDALIYELGMHPQDSVLDLCCGKGRHSIYLASKDLDVVGVDLSPQSIAYAKTFEKDNLSFDTHDMRLQYREGAFDYVLNLFTSFGYFADPLEDQKVITAAISNLKDNGVFVLDFLNPTYIIDHLVPQEIKTCDGITFDIKRACRDGFITKSISFEDHGQQYHFQERVRAITLDQFQLFFKNAGISIQHIWGDYGLQPFDKIQSPRMILIGKKH